MDLIAITPVLLPYVVLSATIAALVLALRESIPKLKRSLLLSRLAPVVIGAIAGYVFKELHPKDTSTLMGAMYGLLAGSFSAPIYHAIKAFVAVKLKGQRTEKDAGQEHSFSDLQATKKKDAKDE